MDDAAGEAEGTGLRVAFDRRVRLEFHGATVTSDAGLLAFRDGRFRLLRRCSVGSPATRPQRRKAR